MRASGKGQTDVVQPLLSVGAQVDLQDKVRHSINLQLVHKVLLTNLRQDIHIEGLVACLMTSLGLCKFSQCGMATENCASNTSPLHSTVTLFSNHGVVTVGRKGWDAMDGVVTEVATHTH